MVYAKIKQLESWVTWVRMETETQCIESGAVLQLPAIYEHCSDGARNDHSHGAWFCWVHLDH